MDFIHLVKSAELIHGLPNFAMFSLPLIQCFLRLRYRCVFVVFVTEIRLYNSAFRLVILFMSNCGDILFVI